MIYNARATVKLHSLNVHLSEMQGTGSPQESWIYSELIKIRLHRERCSLNSDVVSG